MRVWSYRFTPTGRDPASPWQNISIEKKDLARRIVIIALVSLRDSGAMTMSIETKKMMKILSDTRAWATPTGEPEGALTGIEGELLEQLHKAKGKPIEASNLVYFRYDLRTRDPWGLITGKALLHAAHDGLYVEQGRRGMLGRGGTDYAPVVEAIEATRPAANEMLDRWDAFVTDERDLYQQLKNDFDSLFEHRARQ